MKISLISVLSFFTALFAAGQMALVDPSFDPGNGPNGEVNDIQVLPDGRILVGGAFTTWNGAADHGLARLNNNGSLDPAFSSGVNAPVHRIFFQDGILWVQANDALLRLQENGARDTNVPPFQISGMAVASGNFIYRVWIAPRPVPVVDLHNAQGEFQQRLLVGSVGDAAYVMEPLAGGGMLLAGALSHITQNLELFTPAGFDTNFVANAPRGVRFIALGPNSIYVAADNTGASPLTLARLDLNGQLDTNFNAAPANLSALAVTPDDRLVYGRSSVTRLNADGSVDTNFHPMFSADANINALAVQSDGRVLVGGSFTSVDGLPRHNIARLLAQPAPIIVPTNGTGGTNGGNGTGFTVSGFVTDGVNGVPDVRIRLGRRVTFTDDAGAYQFTNVPAGRYVIHANARKLFIRPAIRRVRVTGDVVDINFIARSRRR
jgi:uncharacterized delta-60 repeat protein